MALPTYIPIADAADKYGYDLDELKKMAQSGKINAAVLPGGDMVVSESSIKGNLRKEDLPEYKQFIKLKGTGLGLRESADEYNLPVSTLRGWVTKKIVSTIGIDGRKTLLDQADVAYCAKIYHAIGGQGKRIFNLDGTPYKPKTGPLAE